MTVDGKGVRRTWSQCPFQIEMWDEQGRIATATAFFYEAKEEWSLVTNWHVVSGKDPFSGEPLSRNPIFPVYAKIAVATWTGTLDAKGDREFVTCPRRHELYGLDRHGGRSCALWFEHPEYGRTCDVVAFPLGNGRPYGIPDFMHNAANRISSGQIPIEPGGTIFVVGFPQSIAVNSGLPIWKSGYIASEPYYNIIVDRCRLKDGRISDGLELPALFIDTLTRQGMSGSPVFSRFIGTWDRSSPYRKVNPDEPGFWERRDIALFGSEGWQFVGCYGARIGRQEEGAALGVCYRDDAIFDICTAKVRATHPHIS